MRRLTRYVFRQLLLPTGIGLLLFTFVLLMNHLFFVAQEAIARGLSWGVTGKLVLFELPRLFVMTIPMGTLLGVLVAVGRLSADEEWTAMQAAGLGLGALLRPAVLFGALMATLSFLVYTAVFPHANYATRQLRHQILARTSFAANLRPRVFYTELPGTVLFVSDIRPGEGGRLRGVLVHRSRGPREYQQLILARAGDVFAAPDGSGAVEIELRHGTMHIYRPDAPDDYRIVPSFGLYHERLEPAPILQALKRAARERVLFDLTLPQLLREARDMKAIEEPIVRELRLRSVWREIHARFALPAAALLFAVLAVPLGLTRARSGKAAGFAVSTLVIAVYWVVYTFARDQGARGRIPIVLGVWAADGLMLFWALAALWRVRRGVRGRGWFSRLRDSWAAWRYRRRLRTRAAALLDTDLPSPPHPVRAAGRWFPLVDRYISQVYGRLLLLAAVAIYVIYAVVELKNQLDRALANEKPLSLALQYLQYAAPGMTTVILPVAVLVAAVVCFTLLARSGELTALLASGISLWRAALPVVSWTGVLCVLFFLVQDRVAPVTNRQAEAIQDELAGRGPRTYGLTPGGRWSFGTGGRLYHYQLYDPLRMRFQGLSFFTVDRETPRILSHGYALTALWEDGVWVLGPGWQRTFQADGTVSDYERFQAGRRLALDPPEYFAERERLIQAGGDLPDQLTLAEIRRQIGSLEASGYDTTRLEVAYHIRLAHPLTPLVMVLLGLPFAFRIGRRGSMYGIGVALLLVIVYWATFAVFRALGLEAMLPPPLAAWAPHALYAFLGLYLLLHVRT